LGAAGNRLAFHSVAEIIENENSYESSLERNSSPEIYVPKTQNNDAEGATRYLKATKVGSDGTIFGIHWRRSSPPMK
jgi:hypothetical protein